jgi:hypothetical protein
MHNERQDNRFSQRGLELIIYKPTRKVIYKANTSRLDNVSASYLILQVYYFSRQDHNKNGNRIPMYTR